MGASGQLAIQLEVFGSQHSFRVSQGFQECDEYGSVRNFNDLKFSRFKDPDDLETSEEALDLLALDIADNFLAQDKEEPPYDGQRPTRFEHILRD